MIIPKSIFISIPLFIINPLLGIVSQICLFGLNKHYFGVSKVFFYLFLSVFLGLINSTKLPETDLYTYNELFDQVPQFPFFEYLFIMGKEPFFSLLNYIGFYLTAGNFKVYICGITIISYMFIYLAVDRYFVYKKNEKTALLFAILFITVFSEFFMLSGHLVRQFLAACMAFNFFINYIYHDKKQWWLLVLSILTHSTVLFFLLLLFIPTLRQKINFKNLVIVSIIGITFSLSLFTLSKFLYQLTANIPLLGYVFSRTTEAITRDDGGIGLAPMLLMIIMGMISLYSIYMVKKTDKKDIYFSNIYLVLVCFIFATISQPLLSLRFLFYTYFFVPFILVKLFSFKYPYLVVIQTVVILIMTLRFFVEIETGIWNYRDLSSILVSSIFNYF